MNTNMDKNISIKITKSQYEMLKKLAETEGRSKSSLIRFAIKKYFETNTGKLWE